MIPSTVPRLDGTSSRSTRGRWQAEWTGARQGRARQAARQGRADKRRRRGKGAEDKTRQRSPDPGSDRRVARGSRTRDDLMDAVIELIDGGHPTPTGKQVAERTGVAVRTLYHHFGRLEALWTAAVERQLSHHRTLITAIPPHGPAEARIGILAGQRRRLFDAVGPVLQAYSAPPAPQRCVGRDPRPAAGLLRDQLARTLAPELDRLGPRAPAVLDAVGRLHRMAVLEPRSDSTSGTRRPRPSGASSSPWPRCWTDCCAAGEALGPASRPLRQARSDQGVWLNWASTGAVGAPGDPGHRRGGQVQAPRPLVPETQVPSRRPP